MSAALTIETIQAAQFDQMLKTYEHLGVTPRSFGSHSRIILGQSVRIHCHIFTNFTNVCTIIHNDDDGDRRHRFYADRNDAFLVAYYNGTPYVDRYIRYGCEVPVHAGLITRAMLASVNTPNKE